MGALIVGCVGGRKLYILGVAGYDKPIWDVLVPEGEWEEAAEHIYGGQVNQFLPNYASGASRLCLGSVLLLGSLGSVFHRKKCVL